MEVVIGARPELAVLAADAVERLLRARPDAVLGLATGSTPGDVHDELVRRHAAGLSFARARAFLLDEYVGLPDEHPERYRTVIDREFTGRVDFDRAAVAGPDGSADDLPGACASFEAIIAAAGGVDLQVLGIGTDGHVPFNEPGSSLASRTRIKTLTEQTRQDNARFFDGAPAAVPRHVLAQGLGTIMDARHLVLLAMGRGKAEAVHQLVDGAECPLARDGTPSAPPRHGAPRRGRRRPAAARRSLPADLAAQAAVAGALGCVARYVGRNH